MDRRGSGQHSGQTRHPLAGESASSCIRSPTPSIFNEVKANFSVCSGIRRECTRVVAGGRSPTRRAAGDLARPRAIVSGVLLGAGLGAVALGGALSVWGRAFSAGLWLQATGAVGISVAGFWALGSQAALGDTFTSSFVPRFGVDGLSGLFLGILGLIAAPALVFSVRYLRPSPHGRAVGALTALFVLALALVLCARDPLTFLAGWESMTLVPAVVILVSRGADRRARKTVFTYLAVTHLGGAGTWVAILLLAHAGAIGGHTTIASGSGLQTAIAVVGARRDGDEGRGDAAARVAAARAPDRAGARLGADERRDDQGRDLRAGARARRMGRRAAGLVRRARPCGRRALCARRRRVRAVRARPQASARAALDREHRDHRAGHRRKPRAACARRRYLGGVRTRRSAAPLREPRGLQGVALPRCGRVRARCRLARDRPARRPPPPHAVVGWCLPGRSDGDRGPAAAERLRLGVADAAGADPRSALRPHRRRRCRRARARRARRDGGSRGVLLRESRRPRAARRSRERRRSPPQRSRRFRCALHSSSSPSPALRSASLPASCSARSSAWRPGRPP